MNRFLAKILSPVKVVFALLIIVIAIASGGVLMDAAKRNVR